MLRSMTGFGQGSAMVGDAEINVELRSVNHRFRELKARLPRELSALEPLVISKVSGRVERGMVEIVVRISEHKEVRRRVGIDDALAEQVVEALRELIHRHGLEGSVSVADVIAFEGVISVEDAPLELEPLAGALGAAVDQALDALLEMREEEGSVLSLDLAARLSAIEEAVRKISKEADGLTDLYRERLLGRISTIADEMELEQGRIEAEVAFLAERSDITEELIRLRSHISQAKSLIGGSEEVVGRRIGFLLQEMNREVNTIGSKSQHLDISRFVVDIKAELERVREQVQNIE